MLKAYNLTISKYAIFLFHTLLSLFEELDFFHLGLFVCSLGVSFVCFGLCLGLHWPFFLLLLFLFSQGLFQSLYKLCSHQEKILTFCCPLNVLNKGLNLIQVLVQWNFCLCWHISQGHCNGLPTTSSLSWKDSSHSNLQKYLLAQDLSDRAFPNWKLDSFFEVLFFFFSLFCQELHPKHLLYRYMFPVSNYWLWRDAESAVRLSGVGGLSVSHTSVIITGPWLLLDIVCSILYSNSGLSSIISYSIGWIKENSNIL